MGGPEDFLPIVKYAPAPINITQKINKQTTKHIITKLDSSSQHSSAVHVPLQLLSSFTSFPSGQVAVKSEHDPFGTHLLLSNE